MASWTEALGGLFQGTPQSAPSYTTSTTEAPKWLQDYTVDLFSQARGVAGLPYQPYQLPRIATPTDATTQSQNMVRQNVGAWQPGMQQALEGQQGLTGQTPGVQQGLGYMGQAAGMNPMAAANPYFGGSAAGTVQGMQGSALNVANPFLNAANQQSTNNIQDYMNPYTQNVTDQIARMGARNLSENLLPGVSDQFIRAGQFGSSRMGEFGSRALRDTQESVLGQQSQALQNGYTQALNASQGDLSRQAGLANTAGSLAGTDYSRMLQGAQQLGNLGQQVGTLGNQTQQNLANIGQGYATTSGADASRQQSALQAYADMIKQQQGLRTSDAAALGAVGEAQQAQQQRGLDVAYQDFLTQQQYPQQQVNFQSNILRGLPTAAVPTSTQQTSATTQYGASPLSQLASAYFVGQGLTK